MKPIAVKRAQEALRALATEESLEERLNLAWSYLDLTDSESAIEDSNEISTALQEVRGAFEKSDPRPTKAKAITNAIEAIFEEYGGNEKARHLLSDS